MAKRGTCNLENRTIFCRDNIDILRGVNSGCIDLIYLDPPFNKNRVFAAPIGSSAEGAEFSDIFREEDLKEEWVEEIRAEHYEVHEFLKSVKQIEGRRSYNFCYLAYMAIRLVECHRILKDTGSIYLHCDPTMSHYLKLLLDCIFGGGNFRNEIIWAYTGPGSPKMRQFNRKHDVIFWYAKGSEWVFNGDDVRLPYKDPMQRPRRAFDTGGSFEIEAIEEMRKKGKIPETWWADIAIVARSKKENTGYPTQKPLKLLERIIRASSNKGDMVLDPFCGCATTCVAAEKLERQWVGIDVSHKAYDLVKERLEGEVINLFVDKINLDTKSPRRTDLGEPRREERFVYVISNEKYPGEYKVGIAADVGRRLGSYQTSDPERAFNVEFKIKTAKFRAVERAIHEKYENKHEWIRGDLDAIIRDMKRLAK